MIMISLHYQLLGIRKDLKNLNYIAIHCHLFFVQSAFIPVLSDSLQFKQSAGTRGVVLSGLVLRYRMDPPHLYIAAEKQWYTQNGPLTSQAIQVETKIVLV